MWFQVQRILTGNEEEGELTPHPTVLTLRKPKLDIHDLKVGKSIRFSDNCPLKPLRGTSANVIATRYYHFGEDTFKSHQLKIAGAKHYFLTVAEDEQGPYLGISRLLNESEQDEWFGRDALGFFTEASSAKSIRCKADLAIEADWAAARYSKTVDWVEGGISLTEGTRLIQPIHYNLLVNEGGDKALEVEHEDATGENRFFITVYRPIDDIAAIEASTTEIKEVAANDDVPLFKEPALTSQPKPKQDFRRLDEPSESIHIERTPLSITAANEPTVDLPSFLVPKENDYLSLDQVIPPEPEQVRVGLGAARNLIELALRKNVRVRDVLRDMVGLQSALSEEVIFELPLSDEDYRTLAMRYKLRPDHRIEIRSRLEEELRQKLGIAKPH